MARLSGDDMRIYLETGNPRVKEIMDGIIQEIVSRFHPKSIIVAGGFGRNEASVIEDGDRLKFLSDCEIVMASRWQISQSAINRLALELSQKTGLRIILNDSIRLRIYSRTHIPSMVSNKVWRPSIRYYDLKHGSMVVFGDNILERLPNVKPQDIPLWEGIVLIFNRMAEALTFLPYNRQEQDESIYWINKVIFACQDALLVSVGQYHYSYKMRNLMFEELFPNHFSELNERLPKFLPLASKATHYKLRPTKAACPEDVMGLWFDAAEICNEVFKYIIKRDMGITFDSYVEFQEKYLKHPNVRRKYYLGITSFPVFRNAITALRMMATNSYRFLPPKLIANIGVPWQHIVYSIIPLVYFGPSREGKINELQLKQARDTLSLFKRLKPQNKNPADEWRYIKEQTIELWHTLCY